MFIYLFPWTEKTSPLYWSQILQVSIILPTWRQLILEFSIASIMRRESVSTWISSIIMVSIQERASPCLTFKSWKFPRFLFTTRLLLNCSQHGINNNNNNNYYYYNNNNTCLTCTTCSFDCTMCHQLVNVDILPACDRMDSEIGIDNHIIILILSKA